MTAAISASCIFFVAISVSCEVIARYFFRRPLMWTVEISEYLQIYFVFLSAAWVLRKKGHVTLDIAVKNLGPTGRKVCAVAKGILGILVTTTLCITSTMITYEQMVLKISVIGALELPKWLILAPIPLGMFLLVIEFSLTLINDIRRRDN